MNWGIGLNGKLLKRVPEDMKYFREMTNGKVVVMGRETFESLPGKQPLKGRSNIVLSSSKSFNDDLLIICRSINELLLHLEPYNPDDVYVIGGESVYAQLLPYCSEVYVTRFEKEFEADRHFPNLDVIDGWRLVSESKPHKYEDMGFRFLKYANANLPG